MASTMKAAVAHELGKPLRLEEVPIPQPGRGEVLVKVMASGVCHTDVHAVSGDWPVKPSVPFIPGHEGVGLVAATGSGVTEFREGDAIGTAWLHDACGHCEYCRTGWDSLCHHQNNSGYSVNGSFAEYTIASAAYAARLPRDADFVALAPILCAGVTAYKGIRETEVRPGEWLAISGIGGLGQLGIQYARAMGMRIVALDVSEEKLALARSSGADVTINASKPDALAQLLERTEGGVHGGLVTAVSAGAFSQAIHFVRRRGTIALVGLPPGEFPTPIFPVVLGRITIRGSIVGGRQDLVEALEFATQGKVRAHVHTARLEDINGIFSSLKAGTVDGRMVIRL